MNTKYQMTVDGIRLPHLSRHRTFSATFEIAPEESGDFGFGVIMGIDMMDDLGIDTSRTTKTIIWGNNIEVPMVSKSYWTEACIQALCGTYRRKPSEISTSHNITSEPNTIAQEESSLFLAESEPAQPTSSFTKAVYVKPDLLKAVKRDGVDLTTDQQALLFKTLSDHDAVFQGGKGNYTGEPVTIRLKPDAVPKRAWRTGFQDNAISEPSVVSVLKNMKTANGQAQLLEFQRRMAQFDLSLTFEASTNTSSHENSHFQRQKKFLHLSRDSHTLQVSI
jgi:hypothetical protein